MLGRLTGEVLRPAPAGARYVVTGWRIEVERRKHFAGTAVFDAAGRLVARARAVWIGTMP
jgi:acyl-coenzyme A thioesterase PaaI-like protein